MKSRALFFSFLLLLVITPLLAANDSLPVGLQKIIDYNNKFVSDFSVKISFFIAFAAGMLGILSPCILPILPAYFAVTFKEKRNITKMTFVFFAGFSLVFVGMGVVAGFIGERSLSVLQSAPVTLVAGGLLVFLGFLTIFGKGFSSFVKLKKNYGNDVPGVLLSGAAFALGWTACLGPVLVGILGIGALLGNIFYAALLMFFYSLGNLVPLFLLSIFYDKLKLYRKSFFKAKGFDLVINKKKFTIQWSNLVSGGLLALLGLVIMIYQGTSVFNTIDILGTKQLFYSLQNFLIGWEWGNAFSFALFAVFVLLLALFFWRSRRK